jgi:hypothetical protein
MIQQYHLWVCTQKNQSQLTVEMPVNHVYCGTIHNSQIIV